MHLQPTFSSIKTTPEYKTEEDHSKETLSLQNSFAKSEPPSEPLIPSRLKFFPTNDLSNKIIKGVSAAIAISIMIIAIATFNPAIIAISAVVGTLCIVGGWALSKNRTQSKGNVEEFVPDVPEIPNVEPNNLVNPIRPEAGFKNGGNTCFIAAALQMLRRLPHARERLANQKYIEGEEDLALKKEIQQTLFTLLKNADEGITAPPQALKDLRALLLKLEPEKDEFEDGKPADSITVLQIIFSMLDIKVSGTSFINHKGEFPTYDKITKTEIDKPELDNFLQQYSNEDYLQISIWPQREQETPFFWRRYPELKVFDKNNSEIHYNFKVTGVITNLGGHALCYIREEKDRFRMGESWIKFDDGKVSYTNTILEKTEENLDPDAPSRPSYIIIYSRQQ
jgi:ubiquitin C-terminal hydrolase